MKIKLSEDEASLIKKIIELRIKDPSPCNKCDDRSRAECCGCGNWNNWYYRHKIVLDDFEKLKDSIPSFDFESIINVHERLYHANKNLKKAQENYELSIKNLADLKKLIDNPLLLTSFVLET